MAAKTREKEPEVPKVTKQDKKDLANVSKYLDYVDEHLGEVSPTHIAPSAQSARNTIARIMGYETVD